MPDETYRPRIKIDLAYVDPPDLIEIRTHVTSGNWCGGATAYTSPWSLGESCSQLIAWSRKPTGEVTIEAGADTGIGRLVLRFYTTDLADHAACYVTLASPASDNRKSLNVARLALEVPTELGLIERFATQLNGLCQTLKGGAILEGLPNPLSIKR